MVALTSTFITQPVCAGSCCGKRALKVLFARASVRKIKQAWDLEYKGRQVRVDYLDLSLLFL